MNFNLLFVIALTSFGIFYLVVRLLKKHTLHPPYAILWVLIGFFLLSVVLFEAVYAKIARSIFGLYGGDHLIYISLISFLLLYSFFLTTKICMMSDRVSKLISFTAVLENEISNLKNKR